MTHRSIALVAGASGTIGGAITRSLAERGYDVIGLSQHTPTPVPGARSLLVDLASDTTIAALKNAIDAPVDVIVHAAGAPLTGHVLSVDRTQLATAFEVKVGGLTRMVEAAQDRFSNQARVIAISGNLGHDPVPAAASAGIANAAVANLIRQLSRELAPRGVGCFAIAPGPVEGPRLDSLIERISAASGVDQTTARKSLLESIPAGRFTTVDDIIWAVLALLDPRAIVTTGSSMILDGGQRTAIP